MQHIEVQQLPAREGAVLNGLVEEYIKTARPVGSSQLVDVLRLSLSPATVRNIFRLLEQEHYVQQPHTSAGRIPTDRGFRYYVDAQQASPVTQHQRQRLAGLIEAYMRQYNSPARAVAQALADATGMLAVGGWLHDGDIRQAGLLALARELSKNSQDAVQEVLEMVDNIELLVEELSGQEPSQAYIYIGEENPVSPTKHTSIVVRHIMSDDGDVMVMLVGPKRMPYRRNVAWLNSVAGLLEELDV